LFLVLIWPFTTATIATFRRETPVHVLVQACSQSGLRIPRLCARLCALLGTSELFQKRKHADERVFKRTIFLLMMDG